MAEDNNPPEKEVKDFRFQQLCKVRVFDSPQSTPTLRSALIAASSTYGLTFVAGRLGYKVLKTSDFQRLDQQHATDRLQHIITDFPIISEVTTGTEITHLALSCDDLTLAVVTQTFVLMYDVRNFTGQASAPVTEFLKLNVGQGLLDLAWNPVLPTLLVTCEADGKLNMYEVTNSLAINIKATLAGAKAQCLCWSPKGKQLVIGTEDGVLVQYDPDLKEKRRWPYPTTLNGDSCQALDVVWLSTYAFLVACISKGADCSEQPQVVLVNGSKDGPASYTNFEDVCFGTGEDRKRKYFYNMIQRWDMVLLGSSNASEISIIAKHMDQKQHWERWNLDDAARAECPLTDDYADTYPMGVAIDLSSQAPIPLGDDKTAAPCPLLLVLSTEGLIIPYHLMYQHKDAPAITAPIQALNPAGLRKGQPAAGAGQSTAVKNLFGSASANTSAARPLFGAGQGTASAQQPTGIAAAFGSGFVTTATDHSGSKPAFNGGQTITAADQSTSKAPFGSGIGLTTTGLPASKPIFGAGPAPTAGQFSRPVPGSDASNAGTGVPSFTSSAAKATAFSGFAVNTGAPAGSSGAPAFSGVPAFSSAPAFSGSSGAPAGSSVAPAAKAPFTFQLKTTSSSAASSGFSFQPPQPASSVVTDAVGQTAAVGSGAGQKTDVMASTASNTPGSGFGFGPSAPLGLFSKPVAASGSSMFTPPAPTTNTAVSAIGQPRGNSAAVSAAPVVTTAMKKPVSVISSQASAFSSKPAVTVALPATDQKPAARVPRSPGRGTAPPPQYKPRSPPQDPPPQRPVSPTPDKAITDTVDSTFANSIKEEMLHFEREIADLKGRAAQNDYKIGTDEDIGQLKRQTQQLSMFSAEIRDMVKESDREVQDQSSLALDMFAMVEDCRSRQQLQKDPKYYHLLKSRALDPGSTEKLQQLRLQYQVLDQGVRDVDLILDTQWEEYQNKKKNRSNRLVTPTNDAVYRVVKSNYKLIQAQKSDLKKLEGRLKQLQLYNKTSMWNDSSYCRSTREDSTELLTLANSLVETSGLPLPGKTPDRPADKHAGDRSTSRNKLSRLREHLYRRHVPVVRSTKPENLSMSRLVVPDSLVTRSPEKPVQSQPAARMPGNRFTGAPSTGILPGDSAGLRSRSIPSAAAIKPPGSGGMAPNVSSTVQVPHRNMQSAQATSKGSGQSFGPPSGQVVGQPTGRPSGQVVGQPSGFPGGNILGKPTGLPTNQQPKPGSLTAGFGMGQGPPRPPFGTTAGSIQGVGNKGTDMPPPKPPAVRQMVPVTVDEVNGIKLETLTPSGSEDQDETEEDDEYDEESSGSNGQGFGAQYNMPASSESVTGPSAGKFGLAASGSQPGAGSSVPPAGAPVSRNLFGSEKGASFKFGGVGSTTGPAGFSFGSNTDAAEQMKPGLFSFTPATSAVSSATVTQASTKPSFPGGFQFSTAATSKPAPETETSKPAGGDSGQEDTSDVSPDVVPDTVAGAGFPTGSQTSSAESIAGGFGQATESSLGGSIFGQKTSAKPLFSGGIVGSTTASSGFPASMSSTAAGTVPSGGILGTTTSASSGFSTGTSSTAAGTVPSGGILGTTTSASSGFSTGMSSTPSGTVPSGGILGTTASASSGFSTGMSSTPSGTVPSGGIVGITSASSDFSAGMSSTPAGTVEAGQPTVASSNGKATPTTGVPGSGTGLLPTPSSGKMLFGKPVGGASVTASADGTSTTGDSSDQPAASSSASSATTTSTGASTSVFGQKTTISGGLFGQPSTAVTDQETASDSTSTPISTPSMTALFGSQPPSSSTGQAATFSFATGLTATTTASSVFGRDSTGGSDEVSESAATSSSGGLFGTTTTASTGGLFGQPATTSSGGLFGSPSSSGGLFGSTATTSSGGLFGTSTTTTSSGGLFGTSTTTTSSGGLFGTSTTTSTGGAFDAATTGTGLFGNPASSGSLFGTTSTSSGGLFGTPSTTGSAGAFGSSTTSSAGLFGSSTTTTASGGLFGSSGTSSSGGLFGSSATTTSSGALFGSATTTSSGGLFGSATTTSSGGLFGQSGGTTGGLFGTPASSSGGFGTTTSSPGFGFGQSQSGESFGAKPAFGQSPGFGQAPSSGFGQATTTGGGGGGGGGGMFSGLGGKPSAEKAGTNVFGSSQTFGSAQSSAPGLFGSSSTAGFGSAGSSSSTGGGAFGGGFTSGGSGVGTTGFGAVQEQSTGGFGGASTFGAAPAFGSTPGFGSPPAFGSGSPGGGGGFGTGATFGNPVGGSTFGSPGTSSGGFANFASGGAPTFGALAQSTDVPAFGSMGQQGGGEAPGGFGGGGGGGMFGSPAFGGNQQQQSPAFGGGGGGSSFGSSPSFTGYRG